jgi:hypothetical protein
MLITCLLNYIAYKIKKEDKRYEISFLIVTYFTTKLQFQFFPICFVLHFHLEKYIMKRFCLTLSYKKYIN